MKMEIRTVHDNNDNGADLVGLDFMDDGIRFTITGISTSNGDPTITYIDPLKPLKDVNNMNQQSRRFERGTIKHAYFKPQTLSAHTNEPT